jgi:hypothetical protein
MHRGQAAPAGWSPRPERQCVVLINKIVCFGGYEEVPGFPPIPANPTDMWASRDGMTWTQLQAPVSGSGFPAKQVHS